MSNIKYQCPRCLHLFPKKYNLDKHLKRKNPCQIINIDTTFKLSNNEENINSKSSISMNDINESFHEKISGDTIDCNICIYCQSQLKHKKNLRRHYEKCIKNPKFLQGNNFELLNEINRLKVDFQHQINELKQQNTIIEQHNQNILQVVCVGSNDNYLDMLTEELGFDKALGFIKNCALSQLSGDCKLLQKIYFNNQSGKVPIKYLDKKHNKIEFIDEKYQKIVDIKGAQLCQRLANNLQNSYLKGVNYLIKKNLENNMCPNKFLEEYDIQSWNQHIYELSDIKYQKKIMSQLDIPDY